MVNRKRQGVSSETHKQRMDTINQGKVWQVDKQELWNQPPGTVPSVEVRAILKLARAKHRSESDYVAVSWEAQQWALEYYNSQGLGAALDEAFRLETLNDPSNEVAEERSVLLRKRRNASN